MVAALVIALSGCSGGGGSGDDPCVDVECSGHGLCVVADGTAICACEAGYYPEGLSCVEDGTEGPCLDVDCSGHGVCKDVGGAAQCDCETGYHAVELTCVEDGTDPCLGVDCSGHGTCTIVSDAALCDCEPGYHVVGEVTCEPDAPSENPYLEPVNIPAYDSSNSEHCLIPDDGPWSAATLNNAACTHFYVSPGHYPGRPELTTSGTSLKRRTISPYGMSEDHPAKVSDSLQVKVALLFSGASYWTVHKLSSNQEVYHDVGEEGTIALGDFSTNNVIDSLYAKDGFIFAGFGEEANSNTIQNCYCDGVHPNMLALDVSFVFIGRRWPSHDWSCKDNKIINNEFRNFTALRLTSAPDSTHQKNFEGTIVDSNTLWYDGEVYCDADGNQDPSGDYSFAETRGSVTKEASHNPNNPVIFSNNILWGSRPTYPNAPSYLSSPAPGFTVTYIKSKHVRYYGNVIDDCNSGIQITSNTGGLEAEDIDASYNIMNNTGWPGQGSQTLSASIRHQSCKDSTTSYNRVRNPRDVWARFWNIGPGEGFGGNYHGYNTVISMIEPAYVHGTEPDGYDTNVYLGTADGIVQYPNDYVIIYQKFTSDPQTRTIPNVLESDETTDSYRQFIWNL